MPSADVVASADWRALGTQVWLLVTDPARLGAGRQLLEADLAEVDAACSRFRPDSELVTLDHAAGRAAGQPVQVSPLLAEAIAVALRAARLTDGDVDPTVGAAMAAIGYDRDFALVPASRAAGHAAVRAVPGWRQVHLDERAAAADPARRACAWTWAPPPRPGPPTASAARLAAALGCGVLVGLGGDIAVAGEPPAGGWRIRVQDVTGRPEDPADGPSAVVAIREGGLATSSTTARRWRRGGDVLHHILDPRTGLPAPVHWRTVSVAAATCTDANTASTAAIIRGAAAVDWLGRSRPARPAGGSGGQVRTTGGWPADAP